MSDTFVLADRHDVADLSTFVSRARTLDPAAAHLRAVGGVLAVTVCALPGSGLTGRGTVLGLRAFALAEPADGDVVVGLDAVADRLARMEREGTTVFSVPAVPVVVPWAGQAPPRSGWEVIGEVALDELRSVARTGIDQLGSGALAPSRREELWGAPVPGYADLPAGAAFAAYALGFLPPSATTGRLFTQGRWWRLSTPAGQVLAR